MPYSTVPWTVHEHIIPAFHPRIYRRSVRNPQRSRLSLHVKEYRCMKKPERQTETETETERDESTSGENGITIIFAHGVGSTKECYEPFFSDLLQSPGVPPIRAIWAADVVNHGQSYLLNENELGDEVHWFDAAWDVMQMVNHFRDSMSPPLIGMGQSWGCVHVLAPAAWHPRFFQGLLLIEPVVEAGTFHDQTTNKFRRVHVGYYTAKIKDRWPNRDEARKSLLKSPYFASFDKRVFELVMKYELRPVHNDDDDDGDDGGGEGQQVTLTTPKFQQAILYMKPDPPLRGYPVGEDYNSRGPRSRIPGGFYRTEPEKLKEMMPAINCKVHILWSRDDSFISNEAYRNRVVGTIGTGRGGGGGKAHDQVTEDFVSRGGHALPFQNPRETAARTAQWLAGFDLQWREEEEMRKREPAIEPVKVPAEWLERVNKL